MFVDDFIKENGVEMEIVSTDVIDQGWKYFHWSIDLTHDGRAMSVNYYGGKGATEPDLPQVLLNLASDCNLYNNYALEEFLIELGYCDSAEKLREGFKCYEACKENDWELRELFGDKYNEFLQVEEEE